jgi:P4 family phage/plasmid primase-like protien
MITSNLEEHLSNDKSTVFPTGKEADRNSPPAPPEEDVEQEVATQAIYEKEGLPYIQRKENGPVQFNDGCLAALVAHYNQLIYQSDEGVFYRYENDRGLWLKLSDTAIRHITDQEIRPALLESCPHAVSKLTKPVINSIVSHLAQRTEKHIESWGQENVIHLKDGMLKLNKTSSELMPFSADYLSRNQIPIEYDEGAECPRFVKELLKPCLKDEDIDLLQRHVGSVLLRRNSAQVFMLIVGAAAGGKSTLLEVIESIIGACNTCEIRTEHLGGRFETYNYLGKTLLTGKDVPGDFLQQKGALTIKKLVGGDLASAERKGVIGMRPLHGDFNMIITANSQLHVNFDGDSNAWQRRILLIRWGAPSTERKRIAQFAKLLMKEEASGILNWMLEGAQKHLRELSEHGKFVLTSAQEERVENLLNESDSIRAFVHSCIVTDTAADVTVSELLIAYEDHCNKMQWTRRSDEEFYKVSSGIIQEKFNRTKSNDIRSRRGYRGLKIVRSK